MKIDTTVYVKLSLTRQRVRQLLLQNDTRIAASVRVLEVAANSLASSEASTSFYRRMFAIREAELADAVTEGVRMQKALAKEK